MTIVTSLKRICIRCTCSECQNDGHPGRDVGPGEAPVQEPLAKECDGHTSVNSQRQESQEPYGWGNKQASTSIKSLCH